MISIIDNIFLFSFVYIIYYILTYCDMDFNTAILMLENRNLDHFSVFYVNSSILYT